MTKSFFRIFFFSLIFYIFFICSNGYADFDNTPPAVKDIYIEKSELPVGGVLSFDVSIVEEETGFNSIIVRLQHSSSHYMMTITKTFDQTQYSGVYHLSKEITNEDPVGEYYFHQIEMQDQAGNRVLYYGYNPYSSDDNGYYISDLYNNANRYYFSDDAIIHVGINEGNPVRLEKIEVKNTSVIPGDNITIDLYLNNDKEISEVICQFATYQDGISYDMKSDDSIWVQEGNHIKVTEPVSDSTHPGNYLVHFIHVFFKDNTNISYFSNDAKSYYIEGDDYFLTPITDDSVRCYIQNNGSFTVENPSIDVIPPVINSVTLLDNTVIKPGVVHVKVDAFDDKGINYIGADISYGRQFYGNSVWLDGINQSSQVLEIPISTSTSVGRYYLQSVEVMDKSGNRTYYNLNHNQYSDYLEDEEGKYLPGNNGKKLYITGNEYVSITEEFDIAFEAALSNNRLISLVNQLNEGETGKIVIDSDKCAKKELFESIKGLDKTLVFYTGTYQWVINGKDIDLPKDIDLSVSMNVMSGNEYGINEDLLRINFPDNGELPGKMNVRIKSDYIHNLYELSNSIYIYYVNNDEGILVLNDNSGRYVLDNTDHWCYFDITHNSSYLASGSRLQKTKIPETSKQKEQQEPNEKAAEDTSTVTNAENGKAAQSLPRKGTAFTDAKTGNKYRITKAGSTVSFTGIKKQGNKVTIPATVTIHGIKYKVTSIAAKALNKNKKVTTVKIGKNVTSIGKNAFADCTKLSSVTLGSSVTTIGNYAFYKCAALTKITIPAKVTKIGKSAFWGCKKLKTITIKTTMLTAEGIGAKAFNGTAANATVKVPKKYLNAYKTWLVKKGINKRAKIKS